MNNGIPFLDHRESIMADIKFCLKYFDFRLRLTSSLPGRLDLDNGNGGSISVYASSSYMYFVSTAEGAIQLHMPVGSMEDLVTMHASECEQ